MDSFLDIQESEQDDWLDVTTKEELLQREVDALKRALEVKTMELTETSVNVDVLRGHKLLLENERSSLQQKLSSQADTLSSVREDLKSSQNREASLNSDLKNAKNAAARLSEELQESIQQKNSDLEVANGKIKELIESVADSERMRQEDASDARVKIEHLAGLVNQLRAKASSMEHGIEKKDSSLSEYREKIQESKKREEILKGKLAHECTITTQLEEKAKTFKTDAGAVAVLAENLRAEKQTLQRTLAKHEDALTKSQSNLQESRVRENQFQTELAQTKIASERRMMELDQALVSNALDLDDAHGLVTALSESLDDMRNQMGMVKRSLEVECGESQRLREKHDLLADELAQKDKDYQAREEHIQEELLAVRDATERRLDELRKILGVGAGYVAPKFNLGRYQPPILSAVMSFV